MANRSYLYITDNYTATGDDFKATGLSEFNYNIPLLYTLLVSYNPQSIPSKLFDGQPAIVGDFEKGKQLVIEFVAAVSKIWGEEKFDEFAEATTDFLTSQNAKYALLENHEIYVFSKEPAQEQNYNIIAFADDVRVWAEDFIKRQKAGELTLDIQTEEDKGFLSDLDDELEDLGDPEDFWTGILYYDLSDKEEGYDDDGDSEEDDDDDVVEEAAAVSKEEEEDNNDDDFNYEEEEVDEEQLQGDGSDEEENAQAMSAILRKQGPYKVKGFLWKYYTVDAENRRIDFDTLVAETLNENFYTVNARFVLPLDSETEAEKLAAVEGSLLKALEFISCKYVARISTPGRSELVFQIEDVYGFEEEVAPWLEQNAQYDIEFIPGEGWAFYKEFVLPTPFQWQQIKNRFEVNYMFKNGADPEKPHIIQHKLYGSNDKVEAAAEYFVNQGFVLKEIGRGEALLTKECALNLDAVAEQTDLFIKAQHEFGVTYQSWTTEAVK